MLWKENAPISKKVYHISNPIMIINRLLGLFPITTVKKGSKLLLKWSPICIFYSYALGILLPILTYRGLIKDISSDRTHSVKIKSSTDIYVSICDITVLELGVIFGIFADSLGPSKFLAFMKYIYEIDLLIPVATRKASRNTTIGMVVTILVITFYITTSDLFVYFRLTHEKISKSYILECYMPFYITYYVVLMNQYKFWYLGFAILRRLQPLNERLDVNNFNFKNPNIKRPVKRRVDTVSEKIVENHIQYKGIDNIENMLNPYYKGAVILQGNDSIGTSTNSEDIFKLMTIYEKICDAVAILNQLYGLTNAITIISILWHLIETPYLLILEIGGTRRDPMSIIVLSSWCLLHIGRLLLLAQPCYACVMEAQKTKDLVCKLILLTDSDQTFKSRLNDFSLLILHRKFEFTASGLATIDRSLVTSVLGAITTYLVILLQFARSEGP